MSSTARMSAHPDDQLTMWAERARYWGFDDFLSPEDGFRTSLSTGTRWRNGNAPGIYFWIAADGQAYVGQSIKPQSRLREHWRNHPDLARACFMPCPQAELDQQEARLVREVGEHFPLRNIKLAVSTSREVPFDQVVSETERADFLAGQTLPGGAWQDFELLTRLQERKFARLLAVQGSGTVLRALQLFVERAIPKPADTEVSFWSVTLFPGPHLLRLNAGQQEVFTIGRGETGGAARVLTDERVSRFGSERTRYSVASYVNALPLAGLDEWLSGERLLACRRLVIQLMRHTTALNSGSHCPQSLRHSL